MRGARAKELRLRAFYLVDADRWSRTARRTIPVKRAYNRQVTTGPFRFLYQVLKGRRDV